MYNIELFCNLLENCRVSKELITQLITKVPMNIVNNYDEKTVSEECNEVINRNIIDAKSKCFNNYECDKCWNKDNCTYINPYRTINSMNTDESSENDIIGYKTNVITNCITGVNSRISSIMPYTNYSETFVTMPKTAILQALLYHFLIKDNLDMIRDISLKTISDILGVSTCCVKTNNELLQACNLIHVIPLGKSRFNIAICNPALVYEVKEKGGKGYITMTKDQFKHILDISKQKLDKDITCVNMIKSELRLLLNADVASNNDKEIGKISLHRYNSIFPKYIQKSTKHKELLLNNSFFKYEKIDNNVILFDISKYKKKELLISDLKSDINADLSNFIKTYNILQINTNLSDEEMQKDNIGANVNSVAYQELHRLIDASKSNSVDIPDKVEKFVPQSFDEIIKDLVDLSIEYGRNSIKNILIRIKNRYIDMENLKIENWGAFVRTQIRMYVNHYGSFFPVAI